MENYRNLVDLHKKQVREQFPELFSSLHEAYAVLKEEVDEFWDIVKQKNQVRDSQHLLDELVQITSCSELIAECFLYDECSELNKSLEKERYKEALLDIILKANIGKVKTQNGEKFNINISQQDLNFIETCKTILR